MLPTRRLFGDDQISHREFFNVFVGSACWSTPRSQSVFKWHVTTFEPTKPFVNPSLAQCFFKSLSKHCDCFCCCFPRKETKFDANTLLSLPSKIRRKQWQMLKKKSQDPIHLSSRTPLCQLMRRAVTYTHQEGADGSTAPLPSRKNSLFFVPPCIYILFLTSNTKGK